MVINEEGDQEKQANSSYNKLKCIFCNCEFSFKEKDIETVVENIPYESFFRKLIGQIQDYIVYRYVTCPWCKSKIKLKLVIDDTKEGKDATTRH